ncbi:VOC family protein [Paenibacillus sp. FSL K6-2862]|uniref:VOC family protein n=1 Tax=Paenibacillus sp. FSL K6-2862 TaxID=2921484 RepID=UPI0030F92D60
MNFHSKPLTYVGQVDLKVQNLKRSLKFYQEVIGFKILAQTDKKALLTADGKNTLLSIEVPDDVVPSTGKTTGLYHYALLLPSRADLARIVLHFAEIDLRIGASDHVVSEALYLSDPDGNGIEIYADRKPSEWVWRNGEVEMGVDHLDFQDLLSRRVQPLWNGLPEGTVMGHVHLHVSDLRMSEEFYIKGLGFEVVMRSHALFISTGRYHHHIALNTWNGVGAPSPSENCVGLKSFTLMYPNIEAINQAAAQLDAIGFSVKLENGAVSTTDPSGNRIQLLVVSDDELSLPITNSTIIHAET